MIVSGSHMESDAPIDYLLGSTDAEHERLIRQAIRLAPVTGRFFREAGIGPGHRVLELGSGVGDVAMLLARLVGPTGEVVAIEREPRSIGRARVRAAEAGLRNIEFLHADIGTFVPETLFDAAVGRYILQFLPDPASTLRTLAAKIKPGGIIAFQEGSWAPFLALSAHLPLWHAGVSILHEASVRSGVNLEMGPALHKTFQAAGLPIPHMRLEMELGFEPEFTRWVSDVVFIIHEAFEKFDISPAPLGDLDTLQQRLHEEVSASNTVVPWIALMSAWSRRQ